MNCMAKQGKFCVLSMYSSVSVLGLEKWNLIWVTAHFLHCEPDQPLMNFCSYRVWSDFMKLHHF